MLICTYTLCHPTKSTQPYKFLPFLCTTMLEQNTPSKHCWPLPRADWPLMKVQRRFLIAKCCHMLTVNIRCFFYKHGSEKCSIMHTSVTARTIYTVTWMWQDLHFQLTCMCCGGSYCILTHKYTPHIYALELHAQIWCPAVTNTFIPLQLPASVGHMHINICKFLRPNNYFSAFLPAPLAAFPIHYSTLLFSFLLSWHSLTVVIWCNMLGGVQSGSQSLSWYWESWDSGAHLWWRKTQETHSLPWKTVSQFVVSGTKLLTSCMCVMIMAWNSTRNVERRKDIIWYHTIFH